VLNLWQKNNVFAPEVIQPLFDLANPDHPIHQQYMQQQQQQQGQQQAGDMSNLSNGGIARDSPHVKEDGTSAEVLNASNLQKFQYQQMMMQQTVDQMGNSTLDSVKFNKQLLEYDYGSEGDEDKVDAMQLSMQQQYQAAGMASGLSYQFTKCLEDPNILKQLQNINKIDVQRYLSELPGASSSMMMMEQPQSQGITLANINSLRGPQPIVDSNKDQDVELVGETLPEVIPINSRSPTPTARHKRRRSRSHSRDRYGSRRRRSRSRSTRSRSRSPRNRRRSSRERTKDKDREKQREIEKERRRKGLPDIKKEHISVCSTTIWVGHLSKLVQQEELSDTFGKYGDIVSIDMIPPRGCAYIVMNRRQDAHKAMQALKNHKMQNRAITLSWAAGKGVKGKEWKDYFDQTLGVTYIPHSKLTQATDFDALEEGGMYDEETLPTWVKEKMKQPAATAAKDGLIMPPFFGMPPDVSAIDTSQPPPNASLLQSMPPFPLGNMPRLLMPGVLPLGVPPPNMLGGMLGVFPPNAAASLDKTTIPPPGLLGFPLAAAQHSNVAANHHHQQQQQAAGDDHMDIEMEDEHHTSTSGKSHNDVAAALMQQAFYNQPPPQLGLQSLILQAQSQAASSLLQNNNNGGNDSDEYSRGNGNRNNRSQSREKDFRRGSRQDLNNRRWGNDSNGRDSNRRDNNSRSRDGEINTSNYQLLYRRRTNNFVSIGNQSGFNRRSGNPQDIPSLLSQPMPLMDGDRQRNNGECLDLNNKFLLLYAIISL
jgi:RNA-binding protein 16